MRQALYASLLTLGLTTVLVGGLIGLGRRAVSSTYWLTYAANYPVKIHHRFPDGHTNDIEIPTMLEIKLWEWSPDGRWLLFSGGGGRGRDLFRSRGGGAVAQRLVDLPGDIVNAAYSPDGEWIAFAGRARDRWALYRIRAEGGDLQTLTQGDFRPPYPIWSPDGEWIAYSVQDFRGRWSIHRIRADGRQARRLFQSRHIDEIDAVIALTWSLDGEWVFFNDGQDLVDATIYHARLDGSELEVSSDEGGIPGWTTFAGGAQYAFFTSARSGTYRIYRLNLDDACDTCSPEVITGGRGADFPLSVSPDEAWLLTLHIGTPNACNQGSGLYLLAVDGSRSQCMQPLTGSQEGVPIWSPLIDLPFRTGMVMAVGGLMMLSSSIPMLRRRASGIFS